MYYEGVTQLRTLEDVLDVRAQERVVDVIVRLPEGWQVVLKLFVMRYRD